jgi:hypothetical protein
MPAKMVRSAPRPPFGAPTVAAVVRAASPYCQNAAKAQQSTPVRGSSGESRLTPQRMLMLEAAKVMRKRFAEMLKDAGAHIAAPIEGQPFIVAELEREVLLKIATDARVSCISSDKPERAN